MTTIAYAFGTLASDSASTGNGTFCGRVRKVGRAQDGSIAAFAGSVIACAVMLRWFEGDRSGDTPRLGTECGGLMVRADGSVHLIDGDGDTAQVDGDHHAIGSGRDMALAAMAAGADPARAVEIVCELDTASRGPVQVERL